MVSFQLPTDPVAYTGIPLASIGNFFGKLPIEAKGIPDIG